MQRQLDVLTLVIVIVIIVTIIIIVVTVVIIVIDIIVIVVIIIVIIVVRSHFGLRIMLPCVQLTTSLALLAILAPRSGVMWASRILYGGTILGERPVLLTRCSLGQMVEKAVVLEARL